jgi:hypothetical protein
MNSIGSISSPRLIRAIREFKVIFVPSLFVQSSAEFSIRGIAPASAFAQP